MLLKFFFVGIIMQASYGIGPFLLPLGIKDKPFKGEFELITTRKLPKGAVTDATVRLKVYRASDGSTRFENFEKDKEGEKAYAVSIFNSTKQEFYFLDVESKSAHIMSPSDSAPESEQSISTDKNIGKKVIENLICLGYQRKRGENDVFKYWLSEELNQIVLAKSVLGDETNTLRLFDIKRLEPDSKMFVVPKDYKPMKIE